MEQEIRDLATGWTELTDGQNLPLREHPLGTNLGSRQNAPYKYTALNFSLSSCSALIVFAFGLGMCLASSIAPFSLISRRDRPYARVRISPLRPLLVRSDEEERTPQLILEVILGEEKGSPPCLVRRNFHQRLSTQGSARVAQPISLREDMFSPWILRKRKFRILFLFFIYKYLRIYKTV